MLKYKGVKRTITKLFLKTLFPKPKYVFYLYCPVEISLSRKNDIESIVEFRDTKKEYDLNFMHSKKIISIDTGSTDLAALMEQILKALPEDLMINFRA
jgi:thymidylate kinase